MEELSRGLEKEREEFEMKQKDTTSEVIVQYSIILLHTLMIIFIYISKVSVVCVFSDLSVEDSNPTTREERQGCP